MRLLHCPWLQVSDVEVLNSIHEEGRNPKEDYKTLYIDVVGPKFPNKESANYELRRLDLVQICHQFVDFMEDPSPTEAPDDLLNNRLSVKLSVRSPENLSL